MTATNASKSDEPTSRLTRLAGAAVETIEQHSEASGTEYGMVLLADGTEGGNCMFGFDTSDDAIEFLLSQAEAICKATGRVFQKIEIGLS